jgi:hypothetical protein
MIHLRIPKQQSQRLQKHGLFHRCFVWRRLSLAISKVPTALGIYQIQPLLVSPRVLLKERRALCILVRLGSQNKVVRFWALHGHLPASDAFKEARRVAAIRDEKTKEKK